jgi:hypothetical protein
MADLTTANALSSLLGIVRKLPIWMLSGLAIAGIAVLFVPPLGGIDLTEFRKLWGVWIWIGTLTALALTVTCLIEAGVTQYLAYRKYRASRRVLQFVPRLRESWWHLAKQQDDTFISQLTLSTEVTNLTGQPVRLVKARLIRPKMKGELVHEDVSLPMDGSPYHSNAHAVPANRSATAVIHLMVRGTAAAAGRYVHATVGITDQFGVEYRLKGITLKDHGAKPSHQTLRQFVVGGFSRLRGVLPQKPTEAEPLPVLWEHREQFEQVDLILDEERRCYASVGRSRGGLGSLNVSLQSEPNFGSTKVGDVPTLLWDEAQTKLVGSENAQRLIKLHTALDKSSRADIERYLISHLDKRSPYADVAYFSFLALHRFGLTQDALQAARSNLAGDKVCGYSNVLGVLSAIVSHEHFKIAPDVYSGIAKVLAGDNEPNFRLIEKITLARLRQADKETAAISQPSVSPASH